ncbi:Regulator of RpoS [Moorella thermoacetica]|uniref:response regulator n=1 Tax=Neomoorella thermoacetica TaxID=1525 RepID=UPI0030D23A6D
MRILVVEDETTLANTLARCLREEGYATDIAYDGEEGVAFAETVVYDLIILDLMLPRLDGMEVIRRLRNERIETPVIMLTARDTVADKVRGLDAGADDYLTKPFALAELLARVRALLRRESDNKNTVLQVGDLVMDTVSSGSIDVKVDAGNGQVLAQDRDNGQDNEKGAKGIDNDNIQVEQ